MPKRRWSDDDRQRYSDGDILKARSVPAKRADGPTADEWDDMVDSSEISEPGSAQA